MVPASIAGKKLTQLIGANFFIGPKCVNILIKLINVSAVISLLNPCIVISQELGKWIQLKELQIEVNRNQGENNSLNPFLKKTF